MLQEINADDGTMNVFNGLYTPEKAKELKMVSFDRPALGRRGLSYERLDQLTIEVLLGVR